MKATKIFLSALIVFLCFAAANSASAQTFQQNTNIDEYSDAQINDILIKAKAQGYSDEQVVQAAQGDGLSAAQAQRLRTRIADIRKREGDTDYNNNSNNNNNFSDTTRRSNNNQRDNNQRDNNQRDNNNQRDKNQRDSTDRQRPERVNIFEHLKPKIFGAELFRNSNNNSFEPNNKLSTPINYIVGPEDRLEINVYGNSVANWRLTVSNEGNINIPGVGLIKVAGKTIEQSTADIKARLVANNYAIGRGTSLAVNLGDIRSIRVILQGQLVKPGTYTLSSLSTVFNALYLARGPSDIGSFRHIEVIRNNRIVRQLDLYDFLVKGSTKDNIALRDQDIIRVPAYSMRVELKGEVKIPALFEVLPGETLQDLIGFSGGFTDQAYTARVKVTQPIDQQYRIKDVFEDDYNTYTPLRGEKFVVDKILDRFENRVIIRGAVFRPGEFELKKGLTVSQLIKNAGGLKEDAFTARGGITRLRPDNTTEQISFSLVDAMSKPSSDIVLQREDVINISSIFDLRDKYVVSIKGEVRNPGEFAYADSMKVADLIVKAGGFTEGASTKRIEVSRRVFDSDPTKRDSRVAEVFRIDIADLRSGDVFALKPYDIVSIYSLPGFETQKTIKIEGEVVYPGNYTIEKKSEKISDIIQRAGGLSATADIDGSSLKRENAAVLGIDKTKLDSAELSRERTNRLRRLQDTYKEEGKPADSLYRNNFIGINLKKIITAPGGSEDLILEDGDVIRVPKEQQIVKVNGEVLYPSMVVYQKGKSFREYVLNAGGYSPKALKRGAYIVYANGTVKGTRKFLFFNIHPRVKPGGEIYVAKKPPAVGNTAQTILGFTTGLATLAAILVSVLNK